MPAAQDDREICVPLLDAVGDLHGLANHGAGDQRDSKTQGVPDLLKHSVLVVGGDGGVDENHLVAGTN